MTSERITEWTTVHVGGQVSEDLMGEEEQAWGTEWRGECFSQNE